MLKNIAQATKSPAESTSHFVQQCILLIPLFWAKIWVNGSQSQKILVSVATLLSGKFLQKSGKFLQKGKYFPLQFISILIKAGRFLDNPKTFRKSRNCPDNQQNCPDNLETVRII